MCLNKGGYTLGNQQRLALLSVFKALSNENRLKIVGILARGECGVAELANLLGVEEPTVSHHLSRLKSVGLVDVRAAGNDRIYRLDVAKLNEMKGSIMNLEEAAGFTDDTRYEAWERKVLRSFLDDDRIKAVPAGYKKRLAVMKWLVTHFDFDTRYTEKEVNAIINRHHIDHALWRRLMVDNGLMKREAGIYWRIPWKMPDL